MGYEYLTSHTSESNGDTSQGSAQTFEGSQDVSGHQITASIGRKFTPLLTAGLSGSYAFRNVSGSAANSGNFQLWDASLSHVRHNALHRHRQGRPHRPDQ